MTTTEHTCDCGCGHLTAKGSAGCCLMGRACGCDLPACSVGQRLRTWYLTRKMTTLEAAQRKETP